VSRRKSGGQDVEALSSQAVYPPLESITAPVIYEAAGLARNVMTGAVSAGSLTRWMANTDKRSLRSIAEAALDTLPRP
jgi:hypothetical protein